VNDALLSAPSLIRQFVNDSPLSPAMSSDGKKIALVLGDPGSNKNQVWVMNADGTGLRAFTKDQFLGSGSPEWSPDGRHLLFLWGSGAVSATIGTGGVIVAGRCPVTYIAPADATLIDVDAEDRDPNASPAFIPKRLAEADSTPTDIYTCRRISWRAPLAPAAAVNGVAASGAGLNAGFTGTLLYKAPGQYYTIDLFSGKQLLKLPANSWAASLSNDASLLTFYTDTPGSFSEDRVRVLRANDGASMLSFDLAESVRGPMRFSPTNRYLASEWHSIDLGDAGGINVATVFDISDANRVLIARRYFDYDSWAWHPDGRLLLVRGETLYATDKTLSGSAGVGVTALGTFSDVISGLQVSPDGTRLAFTMAGRIWISQLDGSGLRQVTRSSLTENAPVWSPDGRWLAFVQNDVVSSGCRGIWVVPADAQRVFINQLGVPSSAVRLKSAPQNEDTVLCDYGGSLSWR
jgi:dipeptidyl aminopeptidase/acylaminoacyl peptidase